MGQQLKVYFSKRGEGVTIKATMVCGIGWGFERQTGVTLSQLLVPGPCCGIGWLVCGIMSAVFCPPHQPVPADVPTGKIHFLALTRTLLAGSLV